MGTIYKPGKEVLDKYRAEIPAGIPPDGWAMTFLGAVSAMVNQDTWPYRDFGPFWWLLKREAIAFGDTSMGTFLDAEWVERLDYGNAVDNILAAYAYYDAFTETGIHGSARHTLAESTEDGGWAEVQYIIADPDLDQRG